MIRCRQCGREGTRSFNSVPFHPWPDYAVCSSTGTCERRLNRQIETLMLEITMLVEMVAYYADSDEDDFDAYFDEEDDE